MFSQTVQDVFQRYASTWLEVSRPHCDEDFEDIQKNVKHLYQKLGYPTPHVVPLRGPIQQIIFPCLIELMLNRGREQAESSNFQSVSLESSEVRNEWKVIWKEAFDLLDWENLDSVTTIGPLLNRPLRAHVQRNLMSDAKLDIACEIGKDRMDQIGGMVANILRDPLIQFHDQLVHATSRSPIYRSFVSRLPDSWAKLIKSLKKDGVGHVQPIRRDWISATDLAELATYHFPHSMLNARVAPSISQQLNLLVELLCSATSFLICENFCFVFLKPIEAYTDERFRFHRQGGPAVRFVDGSVDHRWHGIPIPDDIVDNPKKLKFDRIMNERNGEIRRVLIDMYGFEKFIRHSFPKKIHEDEHGTLYRHDIPEDEPIMVVKVINSTAEPDGSFKEYFLRVPPTTRTAKEGVAWTFFLEQNNYSPSKES